MHLIIKFLKDESGATAIEYQPDRCWHCACRYHGCEPARHCSSQQLFYDLDELELDPGRLQERSGILGPMNELEGRDVG
jgi:hypothetical protein